jgi:hypothetical protein
LIRRQLETYNLKAGFEALAGVTVKSIGCNAVQFGESPTFRRNISPASSGWKSKPTKRPAEAGGKLSEKHAEYLV